eukprot:scaffold62_cov56-Phaeocystis_antarctica.AAC.2
MRGVGPRTLYTVPQGACGAVHAPHHTAPRRAPPHHSDSPSPRTKSQSHGMRSSVGAAAGLTTTLPTGPLTCHEVGGECGSGTVRPRLVADPALVPRWFPLYTYYGGRSPAWARAP